MTRSRKLQTTTAGREIYRAQLVLDPLDDRLLGQIAAALGQHSRAATVRYLIRAEARRLGLVAEPAVEPPAGAAD